MNNQYSNIHDDDALQQEDRADHSMRGQDTSTTHLCQGFQEASSAAANNGVTVRPSIDVVPIGPDKDVRGQTHPVLTPISPTISERGRAKTLPDTLGRFRKAAYKTVAARRFSSEWRGSLLNGKGFWS